MFRKFTYDKEKEEENLARDHGLLEEFNSYKGNPPLATLLEIQKERNRLKGNKFKFNLPDELADKMRNAFMKAKRIADARVEKERLEKERIDKYTRQQNAEKIKAKDISSLKAEERRNTRE